MPDYYQVLNVQKTASPDEIKRAYRRLAHLHHPDKPGGNSATFIIISAAYEVLSDSDKRRMYDSGSYTDESPRKQNDCQSCGKQVPVKIVSFFQNISFFFVRFPKSIEGRLCKGCIENYFWKYTLITFFLGWWGITSFFITIGYLAHNTFVFVRSLSLEGADEKRRSEYLAWFVLVLVFGSISSALMLLLYFGSTVTQLPSDEKYVPVVETTNLDTEKRVDAATKDREKYISLANGTVLYKNSNYLDGLGELTIDNGTASDAVAKLVNTRSGKSIYTVYIRANSTLIINDISDSDYMLMFNLGNDWNDSHKAFEVNSSYSSFEDTFDFVTTKNQYTTFSVTLNPVVGGSAETDSVLPEEFGAY